MNLEQLSDACRVLFFGIGNYSDNPRQKDYRRFRVYPPFPWKMDGTDHTEDDPRFFCGVAEQAGQIKHIRKADIMKTEEDTPITYAEWVKRHENEPGWVNHLEGGGSFKRL